MTTSDSMEEHEARCERCGRCCYEKIVVGDEVILTPIPCKHLDPVTRLCRVYDRRHELQLRCLSVEDGIRARAFPANCPYVFELPDYRPPLEADEVEELNELMALAEDEADKTEDAPQ
ncbi:MAG: CxxCxxCC domain-containing protein [Planctomycetota bacterium]|jgi:uncharacterized cysteine cluster protein YcgN (CxxCxxCC family)